MKGRQFRYGIGCFLCMLVLILDSRTALEGARQGVDLCIRTVIPGLFPFFVLTVLLTGNLTGAQIPFLDKIGNFIGIPGYLLIPVFLGGYPSGAQAVSHSYRMEQLSESEARRLLFFCSQAGPSFLFGVIGSVLPGMIWQLWAVQIGSALLCAVSVYKPIYTKTTILTTGISLPEAIHRALGTLGAVCGWVTIFRVVIIFLDRWLLWLLPAPVQVAVMGIMELTNGCCQLVLIQDLRLRFVLACGMVAFGGICVVMQTLSVIDPLSIQEYLTGKVIQTIYSLLLGCGIAFGHPAVLMTVPVAVLLLKKTVEIQDPVVYNGIKSMWRKAYAVSKKNRTRLRLLPERHPSGRGSDSLLQKRAVPPR